MPVRTRALLCICSAVIALSATAPAVAAGSSAIAALQVGLRAKGVYSGTIDGVLGPTTSDAVRALQARAGLAVDGIAGPSTRAVLGRHGWPELGTRPLGRGNIGWDVAQLQFLLAWQGFPSGPLDGRFGPRTQAALLRFQVWAGLEPDAKLGPATLTALGAAPATCPIALSWPLEVPLGDLFGPRGNRFHTGIDLPAPTGTPVAAAADGRVTYAGWLEGGWGYVVTLAHGSGVRTMYAHLSRVDVELGDRIATGVQVGLVGASGHADGAHLHFEVRLRGASVDPLTGLS